MRIFAPPKKTLSFLSVFLFAFTFMKYIHTLQRFLLTLFVLVIGTFSGISAHVSNRNFVLVIDAGHGGHDAGAVGSFSKEKDINLKVALAFGALVESNCPDVKVIYTRRRDVFIPLQRRADIANDNKADLFISIHTNALPKGRIAYGSETYTLGMARAKANLDVAKRENSVIVLENDYKRTYEGFDPSKAESYVIFEILQDRHMKQSVDLARFIQKQYTSSGRTDKGVHQAGFLVLRNTTMPSVLTELGFISTPAEERYLNSRQGVSELSRSIYNGFLAYRRRYDKKAHDVPENVATKVEEAPDLSTIARKRNVGSKDKQVEVVPIETTPTAELDKIQEKATEEREKAEATAQQEQQAEPATTLTARTSRQVEETPKRTTAKSTATRRKTTAKPRVTYHIQLGAGRVAVSPKDAQFKGLAVKRVKEGSLYKYYYGTCHTYAEALRAQRTAQAKVKGAYMVATVDGKSVSIPEARTQEKKHK